MVGDLCGRRPQNEKPVRKVTKILVKTISATILLLIILPVFLALLLAIPAVQNFAVTKASEAATAYLGTRVSIDHITVGLFNKVKVRGFYVEDYDRDTLIYAREVTAYLGLGSLPKGLTINSGQVKDGKFILRETERGTMNIKEVVDKLTARRRGKGNFELRIHQLDVDDVEFRLERPFVEDKPKNESLPDGVDYTNMKVMNICGRVDDFSVIKGAVSGDIVGLSFRERSGFEVQNFSGDMFIDKGIVSFEDVTIETASSHIYAPEVSLVGESWLDYKDFVNKVRIDASLYKSRLSSDDVGYFAPALFEWNTTLSELSASMSGTVAEFDVKLDRARLEDGGYVRARGTIKGLPDVSRTRFNLQVGRLNVSTAEALRLLRNIAHLELKEKLSEILGRTRQLSLAGSFVGSLRNFDAKADLSVGSGGRLKAMGSLRRKGDADSVSASLELKQLNLGRLLNNNLFGEVSLKAEAGLNREGDALTASGQGSISQLQLKGYEYGNVSLSAALNENIVVANLTSEDAALRLTADAQIDLRDKQQPACTAQMFVEHADLHAMHINPRDSISQLSAEVGLVAVGSSFNTLNGELSVANARYLQGDHEVRAERISVQMVNNEDARELRLESDFADALLDTRCSYDKLKYYLQGCVLRYLPMYYDEASRTRIESELASLKRDNVSLSVSTKAALNNLLQCFAKELDVAPGSQVNAVISPSEDKLRIEASSEYLTTKDIFLSNLQLKADNRRDSLSLSLSSNDLYLRSLHLNNVKLKAGAGNNKLSFTGEFSDSLRSLQGSLGASAYFSRVGGERHLQLRIADSFIEKDESVWEITSGGIDIAPSRIVVNRLRVGNDEQELYVDGVASANDEERLCVRMHNFSLAPIAQITSRVGYEIDGRVNGEACIRSAMRNMRIDADEINLTRLDVNGMPLPDLVLSSRWDFGNSRARLDIATKETRKTVAKGFFSPSSLRYYVAVNIDRLNLGLLDPLLKGIISDTKGTAAVRLTLDGKGRYATLQGKAIVSDLETKVDYTNCIYRAPSAEVNVYNNRLVVDRARVFDVHGNDGTFSMDISLNHLSNIEYNIGITANKMQVLNTTLSDVDDNKPFYGKVFASGELNIVGEKGSSRMDITARSEGSSTFSMPLMDKSGISRADFLTFKKAEAPKETVGAAAKREAFKRRHRRHRTTTSSELDITMNLDVRPNLEMQLVFDPTVGDVIKGRGTGGLELRINPSANIMEMNGTYTIEQGDYLFTLQNVINKWFKIEPGSTVQWSGDPFNALLNINAIYRVKASLQPLLEGSVSSRNISSRAVPVDCKIHITGPLEQLNVGFDVEVENVDSEVRNVIASALSTDESRSSQFLYLLVANSFISESTNNASPSIATSAVATTGFELLSNQLSNWLSIEDYNIVLRYRPRTEQHSDEVDFGFSKGLVNNRLLIEVEGNYIADRTQMVNAASNFTGEAYVTWLIDRAGTLRLKGFTHTIDRFDENQGLQETGLGIYYKEDFNNARDFRERVKARFRPRTPEERAEEQKKRDEARRKRQLYRAEDRELREQRRRAREAARAEREAQKQLKTENKTETK